MGGLLAGLASLAQPILARVLAALGMSLVTTVGAAAVLTQIKSLVISSLAGGVESALMIAGLAGVWTGLGMVWGAITFTVTYWQLTKAVRLATGS